MLLHQLLESCHRNNVFALCQSGSELIPTLSVYHLADFFEEIHCVMPNNFLVQRAVSTSLVVSVVFPAVLVLTGILFLLFDVLSEKESLLRQDLEAHTVP